MAALASGDAQRRNDLDGRGNLSDEGLMRFCRLFMGTAIDQVEFMTGLLDLDSMQERIVLVAERWIARTRGPRRSRTCCASLSPRRITRGEATRILRKPERTARRVLGSLLEADLSVRRQFRVVGACRLGPSRTENPGLPD